MLKPLQLAEQAAHKNSSSKTKNAPPGKDYLFDAALRTQMQILVTACDKLFGFVAYGSVFGVDVDSGSLLPIFISTKAREISAVLQRSYYEDQLFQRIHGGNTAAAGNNNIDSGRYHPDNPFRRNPYAGMGGQSWAEKTSLLSAHGGVGPPPAEKAPQDSSSSERRRRDSWVLDGPRRVSASRGANLGRSHNATIGALTPIAACEGSRIDADADWGNLSLVPTDLVLTPLGGTPLHGRSPGGSLGAARPPADFDARPQGGGVFAEHGFDVERKNREDHRQTGDLPRSQEQRGVEQQLPLVESQEGCPVTVEKIYDEAEIAGLLLNSGQELPVSSPDNDRDSPLHKLRNIEAGPPVGKAYSPDDSDPTVSTREEEEGAVLNRRGPDEDHVNAYYGEFVLKPVKSEEEALLGRDWLPQEVLDAVDASSDEEGSESD